MRIGLIDSSAQAAQQGVFSILIKEGFDVVMSINGNEFVDDSDQDVLDLFVMNLERFTPSHAGKCASLMKSKPAPILVLAANEGSLTPEEILECGVSSYGVGDFDRKRLTTMIRVSMKRFRQTQSLTKELKRSKEQLEERKTIEKAKGLIMTQRGLSEDQAYQHMRKTAMDQGKSMVSLAKQLIEVFELIEQQP